MNLHLHKSSPRATVQACISNNATVREKLGGLSLAGIYLASVLEHDVLSLAISILTMKYKNNKHNELMGTATIYAFVWSIDLSIIPIGNLVASRAFHRSSEHKREPLEAAFDT